MFWGKTKRVPPLIFHALDDVKKVFFIYREPCVDPFWSLNEMILFLYFSYQITTFFPLWCISSPSLAISMVRSGLLIRECSSHELTCSMADNWAISIAHMVEGTARTEKLLVFPNKSNVLVPLHLSCCWSLETEKDPCSSSAHYILQSYRITTTYRCCLWQGFLLEKNWEVSPWSPAVAVLCDTKTSSQRGKVVILAALPEGPSSSSIIHGSNTSVIQVPGDPLPSSGLCKHQTYRRCTDLHVSKTSTQVK